MFESTLVFEIVLIFALIVLNGVFAMSEIAVVSARKGRLRQLAEEGDRGARRALGLAEHPTQFLSTVQIGITAVGIFAGAYGGVSIAAHFDAYLERLPAIAPYSEEIALGVVVVAITFLSLVVGELVPKQIGLHHPERIAALISGPMSSLSTVMSPLVKVLTVSTEGLLRLLGMRKPDEAPVTEEEVAALLKAGTDAGVFEEEEQELVERVFWLSDQRVDALLTPRHRIEWLDLRDTAEAHRNRLVRHRFSHYLVCDGDLDHVQGMVRVKDLLAELLEGNPLDLNSVIRKPLFVPESLRALRLLELFRESGIHLAVVIDEYGGVEGLITLNDVLQEIGGTPSLAASDPKLVTREDGSWLVDASMTMDELWDLLEIPDRRKTERTDYHTLGGLIITRLGRVPRTGDLFESHGLRFEVLDMDGNRVDKVLVSRIR